MADEKHLSLPEVQQDTGAIDDGAPSVLLKHSYDADEAMKAFEDHEGEVLELDEATSKKLLKKIDLNIMPVGCVLSFVIQKTLD